MTMSMWISELPILHSKTETQSFYLGHRNEGLQVKEDEIRVNQKDPLSNTTYGEAPQIGTLGLASNLSVTSMSIPQVESVWLNVPPVTPEQLFEKNIRLVQFSDGACIFFKSQGSPYFVKMGCC